LPQNSTAVAVCDACTRNRRLDRFKRAAKTRIKSYSQPARPASDMSSPTPACRLRTRRNAKAITAALVTAILVACGGDGTTDATGAAASPSTPGAVNGSLTTFTGIYGLLGLWSLPDGRDVAAALRRVSNGSTTSLPTESISLKARTADQAWAESIPEFVLPPHGQVAAVVAPTGQVLVAWTGLAPNAGRLTTTLYSPGGGWSAPVVVHEATAAWLQQPQAVADAVGRFYLAWQEMPFTDPGSSAQPRQWAAAWLPASGWESARLLGPTNPAAFLMAGDRSGDGASLFWFDQGAAVADAAVFTAAWRTAGGWSTAQRVQWTTASNPQESLAQLDSRAVARTAGRTIAAFGRSMTIAGAQPEAARTAVYTIQCDAAPSCSSATAVTDDSTHNANQMAVDLTSTGQAAIVWTRVNALGDAAPDVVAARFNGSDWSAPEVIGLGSVLEPPRVRIANDGGWVAGWPSASDRRWLPHVARRSATTNAWSVPAVVAAAGDSNASGLRLTLGSAGRAAFAWTQADGSPGSVGDGNLYLADVPR
jgi:hypothetical protein